MRGTERLDGFAAKFIAGHADVRANPRASPGLPHHVRVKAGGGFVGRRTRPATLGTSGRGRGRWEIVQLGGALGHHGKNYGADASIGTCSPSFAGRLGGPRAQAGKILVIGGTVCRPRVILADGRISGGTAGKRSANEGLYQLFLAAAPSP